MFPHGGICLIEASLAQRFCQTEMMVRGQVGPMGGGVVEPIEGKYLVAFDGPAKRRMAATLSHSHMEVRMELMELKQFLSAQFTAGRSLVSPVQSLGQRRSSARSSGVAFWEKRRADWDSNASRTT